jgi:hypothetical protein
MRTIPTSAWVLALLTPLLALAQPGMGPTENQIVTTSSSFWFWVVGLAIAIVAFIASTAVISRHSWPPSGPRFR